MSPANSAARKASYLPLRSLSSAVRDYTVPPPNAIWKVEQPYRRGSSLSLELYSDVALLGKPWRWIVSEGVDRAGSPARKVCHG